MNKYLAPLGMSPDEMQRARLCREASIYVARVHQIVFDAIRLVPEVQWYAELVPAEEYIGVQGLIQLLDHIALWERWLRSRRQTAVGAILLSPPGSDERALLEQTHNNCTALNHKFVGLVTEIHLHLEKEAVFHSSRN